jgi:tetratricopeptide (TPR) repeat protein
VGRSLLLLLAAALTAVGAIGLSFAYLPGVSDSLRDPVLALLMAAVAIVPAELPEDAAELALDAVTGFPLRFVLAPVGLVMLVSMLLPGRGRRSFEQKFDEAMSAPIQADKKAQRRAKKQAAAMARKGLPLEAAELCFASNLMDDAAGYFIKAEEYVRAAEIRHDQNRFVESAELYSRGGQHDAAATIYVQQNEPGRAAECYVKSGNHGLAAEAFEKAGDLLHAAQCFDKAEIPREAARCYLACKRWVDAARCLEAEILDLGTAGAGMGTAKHEDLAKLFKAAGDAYQRAGDLARAQAILEKGQLHLPAAEIAVARGDHEGAVELFLKAKQPARAAKVLAAAGQEQEASRILAEYHRDRGEQEEAARHFELSGQPAEAADIYRLMERYDKAGACYEKAEHFGQAADMWNSAGDRVRAGENYERAGQFASAAECFALAGDPAREAQLLEQAGEYLAAARIHHEASRDDEAIAALQQVGAEHGDFAAASALLGEIFRQREMYPIAKAKLEDATRDREIDRHNLRAFYCLATVLEASDELPRAVALYEKILAFDLRYEDVGERLAKAREAVAARESAEAASQSGPNIGSSPPGRYIIRGTLGRGGMGIVYKADDTVLDRTVAFKVLPDTLKENPQALANFLREAKSAAKLNHPNIVTVYDAGEQEGSFYIAMEYVDGNTLKDIIKRRGKIAPKGIVHVLSQMAEALAYAHEKKIVHRDIKTANTMWTTERKAKIMDFGLAKAIEEVRNHTTVVSGTPYYMSPEQTLGKNVDHRTDIYSLGVSVFEMATGTLPFTEGNIPYHHVHTDPPETRELAPELPEPLHQIIARCMRKDPSERYQSAREILAELRSAFGG